MSTQDSVPVIGGVLDDEVGMVARVANILRVCGVSREES